MHLAFVTPEYPHEKTLNSGGIGTSVKNLVEALVLQNVKVTLFVYHQMNNEIFEENGISFHLIKSKKYKLFSWFFYRKHLQKYINKIIIANKIDAIEAPDWTGITAFIKFKVPLVIRFHGSDAYFCNLEKRRQKLKNYWFEKLAFISASAFIAPTNFAGKLSSEIFNISANKIKTINYGLNLNHFKNQEPELFEPQLILYIGTIIRKKGVLELAKIFNLIAIKKNNAKLVVIGQDSFDIETKKASTWQLMKGFFSEKAQKNVTYLGKLPYSEVQNYIKKAHVCVFPTFAETFGMVTIEAMAMQKAVVNSNIGWANELIVDNESGFLVHPKNHEEFANKISQIIEDDNLRKHLTFNAKNRVEKLFDINKIVKENISFYQQIIKKS